MSFIYHANILRYFEQIISLTVRFNLAIHLLALMWYELQPELPSQETKSCDTIHVSSDNVHWGLTMLTSQQYCTGKWL